MPIQYLRRLTSLERSEDANRRLGQSLAFVAGVFPLALSTGAGAGSENDIGTGVIGGMVAATALAIFFVPLFFVLVMRWFPGKNRPKPKGAAE